MVGNSRYGEEMGVRIPILSPGTRIPLYLSELNMYTVAAEEPSVGKSLILFLSGVFGL